MTCCSTTKELLLKYRYQVLAGLLLCGLLTGNAFIAASVSTQTCQIRVDLLILEILALISFRVFWEVLAEYHPSVAFVTGLQSRIIGSMSHFVPCISLAILIMMFRTREGAICQREFSMLGLFWFYIQTIIALLVTFLMSCIYFTNRYFSRAQRLNISQENSRKRHFVLAGLKVLQQGKTRIGLETFNQELDEAFQVLTQSQKESVVPLLVSISQENLSWKLDNTHARKLASSGSSCFFCDESFESGKWITINPSGSRKFHYDCVLSLKNTQEGCMCFFDDVEASYNNLKDIMLKKYESLKPSSTNSSENSSSGSGSTLGFAGNTSSSMPSKSGRQAHPKAVKKPDLRFHQNKILPTFKLGPSPRTRSPLLTAFEQPAEDSGLLDDMLVKEPAVPL